VFTGAVIQERRHTQIGTITESLNAINRRGANMSTERISERPELVIALVGPVGVPLGELSDTLKDYLKSGFHYDVSIIKLSELLEKNFLDLEPQPQSDIPAAYTRITHLQKGGNDFRKKLDDGAALAIAGIAAIREERRKITHNPDMPASSHAYILHQLKHPREVELLRRVYGPSFIMIAGHRIRSLRQEKLAKDIARSTSNPSQTNKWNEKADDIIEKDAKDDDELGQNTRDTYPLADYFADYNFGNVRDGLVRFIELLFGHPFHTPYAEEHAMYQARAVALRSSDDGRQVGAVIAKIRPPVAALSADSGDQPLRIRDLDIVASGMNEVPRAGGTSYMYPDSHDYRDQYLVHKLGEDRAKEIKVGVLLELIRKIEGKNWLKETGRDPKELADELVRDLKGTQFMDIGEFMRPVHAEMAALIDSARRGVAVDGLSMYVTSFPCHNCAKHIIAAGIKRVIYLEPYPKSRATHLHKEEIDEEAKNVAIGNKVAFLPFSGIAPRQYEKVFSMSARGEKYGLSLKNWEASKSSLSPRYVMQNASASYLLAERQELKRLPQEVYKWDKKTICPD